MRLGSCGVRKIECKVATRCYFLDQVLIDSGSGSDLHIFCVWQLIRYSGLCFLHLLFNFYHIQCSPNGVHWWHPHLGSLLGWLLPKCCQLLMCSADFQLPPCGPHNPVPLRSHLAGRQSVSHFHLPLLLLHLNWPAKEAERRGKGKWWLAVVALGRSIRGWEWGKKGLKTVWPEEVRR